MEDASLLPKGSSSYIFFPFHTELLNLEREKREEESLLLRVPKKYVCLWKMNETCTLEPKGHLVFLLQLGFLLWEDKGFIFIMQMDRGPALFHNIFMATHSPFLLLICLCKWVLLNSVGVFQLDKRQFMSPAAFMLALTALNQESIFKTSWQTKLL